MPLRNRPRNLANTSNWQIASWGLSCSSIRKASWITRLVNYRRLICICGWSNWNCSFAVCMHLMCSMWSPCMKVRRLLGFWRVSSILFVTILWGRSSIKIFWSCRNASLSLIRKSVKNRLKIHIGIISWIVNLMNRWEIFSSQFLRISIRSNKCRHVPVWERSFLASRTKCKSSLHNQKNI